MQKYQQITKDNILDAVRRHGPVRESTLRYSLFNVTKPAHEHRFDTLLERLLDERKIAAGTTASMSALTVGPVLTALGGGSTTERYFSVPKE